MYFFHKTFFSVKKHLPIFLDIRPFSVQVEVQYLCLVLIVLEFGVKMNYLDADSIRVKLNIPGKMSTYLIVEC